MQTISSIQKQRSVSSKNTQEWLKANDLPNLINVFVSKDVNIPYLVGMDADELNEYLKKFNITATDKIRLRCKLHHLRVMKQNVRKRSGHGLCHSDVISTQNETELYNKKHVQSLNINDILNYKDEEVLNKLLNHQNGIQTLINYCLNSSTLLNKNMHSSLSLIENEFNNITNTINDKKNEIVASLHEIRMQKLNEINRYMLELKEYRDISVFTMNNCMKLINGKNNTNEMQSMVDNLLNHQHIPTDVDKLNINCNIDVKFNYISYLPVFLSSICCMQTEAEGSNSSDVPIAIVEDLKVIDIKQNTAIVTWNNANNNPNDFGHEWYIDLNISDIGYEMKHNDDDVSKCVLNKKIKLERNTAMYSINLAGLESNNCYKIRLNVNDSNHKCRKQIFKQFKTKKQRKIFGFNIPKKLQTQKNCNRFLVTNHGKTVLLNKYDSGTIVYGEYLHCNINGNENEWMINSVTMKLLNISPSGFGIGFATNKFDEFAGWNTGKNGSVIMYGNGEFYTSQEFMHDNKKYNDKHSVKLFQLGFMRRNDIVTVIVNYKLKKLQIINVTGNNKFELNLNAKYVEQIAIILWFGWTNGQSVTITNQRFV